MKRFLLIAIATLLLSSCEHRGQDIAKFKGEYRYYKGIAEFFVCKERTKYFVADAGIHMDLRAVYLEQGLKEDDDVYMQMTGYYKEEEVQIEGIDPMVLFVPVKLLKVYKNKGCERIIQQGY